MFFRQIAQKNICSYPAFFRRTSVRMIYRPDRTDVFYVCKARQTSDYISLILLQLSDFGQYITTTAVVRYITNIFHLYITSDISSGRFITSDISSYARAGELSLSDFFPTYIYNMYIYRYIYTYIDVYIEYTYMCIDICICRYITIGVSKAYLVSDMSSWFVSELSSTWATKKPLISRRLYRFRITEFLLPPLDSQPTGYH